MNATVFDFTLILDDTNKQVYLYDYKLICFSFDFRTKILSDRRDFSVVSQFAMLSDGQENSNYTSLVEYCNDDKECLRQTIYGGIFWYFNIFDIDKESLPDYKPEFLLRDSRFYGILKIQGYEKWGYLTLDIYRAVRCEPFFDIIEFVFNKFEATLSVSGTGFLIKGDEESPIKTIGGISRLSMSVGLSMIKKSLFRGIIENRNSRKISIFAEINYEFFDYYSENIYFISNTDTIDLDSIIKNVWNISVRNFSHIDTEGFVSNFDIILSIDGKKIGDFYSNYIYFETRVGV
jgi:hypothetical protein